MNTLRVTPSSLNGSITIPPSKSHTMRALLFGALANGKSQIKHYLSSPDTHHMIKALEQMGAKFSVKPDQIVIEGINGQIRRVDDVIEAGNSGIILRFLSGILALSSNPVTITGDHSLQTQRPMTVMLDALQQLSIEAVSIHGNGFAPLQICGPLNGGKVTISGEDSQPISSLLIACSLAKGPTELSVVNPGEKPWIQLTLNWLDRLGVTIKNQNYEHYFIQGKSQFKAFDYTIPGDWSSAAFPIAAALITNSSLTLENIDWSDPQGDKKVIDVLKEMGAKIEINHSNQTLKVLPGSKLKGITIDVNPFIDAITLLAVIACFAEGETQIINASVAREKECDRLHCITKELQKMGAHITEDQDSLVVQGSVLKGAKLESYGDHRMALSLAIAALGAKGESIIQDTDCVAKTFPHFIEKFQSIGAEIE